MTPETHLDTPVPSIPAGTPATEILRLAVERTDGNLALACSFSIDDVVVIDLLQTVAPQTPVFAIDTGRLNEETYAVAESLSQRYGLVIEWYFPERRAVEALERSKGLFSFRESLENRRECCHIRKVEPLQRALSGRSGWITGMRREQAVSRVELAPLEIDTLNGGLLKANPLAHWTSEQVWGYAEQKRLPVNPLHRQGYPSIGCAPCTRAIEEGESPRSGRWWWEDPEHKECGLHRR